MNGAVKHILMAASVLLTFAPDDAEPVIYGRGYTVRIERDDDEYDDSSE